MDVDKFRKSEVYPHYKQHIENLKKTHLEYPSLIAIETLTKCNATCKFCPYTSLERKGKKMPTSLVEKIIKEMEDIPKTHPFQVNLAQISETFLDDRWFKNAIKINNRIPHASFIIITNGSFLNKSNIDKLFNINNVKQLNISLNESTPTLYRKTMGLNWDNTMKNLDLLHKMIQTRQISFTVRLSRVADKSDQDLIFINFVQKRFPLFKPILLNPCNFIGLVDTQQNEEIPDVGCTQWFKLNIHSTGNVAFCCLDAADKYAKYNVNDEHILDIYNKPEYLELRQHQISRIGHPICGNCTLKG